MAQTTTGIRALLSIPLLYRAQQLLWGSPRLHAVTSHYLALEPGQSLLDLGCGPADILVALPEIDYVGVDLSPQYIEAARVGVVG
jgi:ubiquinone/menaquinone biosynthesis C-methylase UbiE